MSYPNNQPLNWGNLANTLNQLSNVIPQSSNPQGSTIPWGQINQPQQAQPKTYTPDDYRREFVTNARKLGYSDQQIALGMGAIEAETGFNPISEARFTTKNLLKIRDDKKTPYSSIQAKLRKMTLPQIEGIQNMSDEDYFEFIYGGRKNLGNVNVGDGYRYRGNGLIQTTGRDNFTMISKDTGVDFVNNPDLVNDPKYATLAAISFMKQKGVFTSKDAIEAAGKVFGTTTYTETNKKRTRLANEALVALRNKTWG